jgi:hypothetical protein
MSGGETGTLCPCQFVVIQILGDILVLGVSLYVQSTDEANLASQ